MLLPVALISTKKILTFTQLGVLVGRLGVLLITFLLTLIFLLTALKCIFLILSGIHALVV